MSDIVCQVSNQAGQVELIWSSRGGFFRPYVISGQPLIELRQAADRPSDCPSDPKKPSCREALETLVHALNRDAAGPAPWEPAFELAEAGFRLFNCLLPTEDETAKKVRRWLEDLRKQSGLIGLEVVVEERAADAKAFLSVPWNLVYDERPAKYKAAFQKGQGPERWRPFWSVRYNLTSGRRVEPLKRMPTWSDPRVVVVVDPTVHQGLNEEQKGRLDAFLAEMSLTPIGSMDELEAALEEGYPRLLYWLGHATPEYLLLGDEEIAPGDLRNLLRSFDDRERPEGMLAFLNACQTAEAGSGGSFLDVLHSFGFTGAIATERQTIDTFANEFGLNFLQGFLREGKPLGELLHGLRLQSAPLGLLYGAHCPPEITVRSGNGVADIAAPSPIRESGAVAGVPLGETATKGPRKKRRDRRPPQKPATPSPAVVPPLPEEPYRSLAFYDEADRALFTGRDADVLRFAATLDRPDTRILILHGESGTGKSSFLRAGVIPYLEHECVGYRFLRRPDGSALIVQAAKDLIGGLAQALLDATATSLRYDTPAGEPLVVNLRRVLDEALGAPADYATLRAALGHDAHLLADVLARMAARLPHALVLIIDQAEEVFTLARTPEEVAGRDHSLRMLQRLVDVKADVKLIVSLRTEYYGRLLDHLRAGQRDLTGVRDDLLRDFSRSALVEAIERPTSETPLAPGQPSPREKYGFHYAEGVPGQIADGVLAMRSENQDSVLPLVQVICTQLYQRERALPGSDGVITREDLEAIKGVEGGLRAFAEDALVRSMGLGPEDREAFKVLFSQLYSRQPDGTLTTWLMPRESLEGKWDRLTPFSELLEGAKSVRLLREDELRIEGGEPRRYVRLGHDALAKVAAAWGAEYEEEQRLEQERSKRRKQFRRLLMGSLATGGLALLCASGALFVYGQNQKLGEANAALAKATQKSIRAADNARAAEDRAKHEADNARAAEDRAKHEADNARAAEKEARDKEEEARSVLGFVEHKILAAARPEGQDGGLGHEVTLRKALEAALPQVEPSFRSRPLVEAEVRSTLGTSFGYLGDAVTSERQFQIARERYTARLGPDHPDTLMSMSNLAVSYAALGRPAEALKLREQTLALQEAKLGPDHPDTLMSMNNLAVSYAALGRHAEALKLHEETLALRRTKLGPDHPDTLMSMSNLAASHAALGRPAEAVKLHEETLALRRAKLGPDHPDTLWSMSGLASSTADLGRPAEAVKLFEEALALQRARLGPDHPGTLLSMNNLANSHAALGRPAEALKLREETLALRRAKLGPDHPDTLLSMSNLADSHAALGRQAEAVKLHEEALALRRAKLGPDHPDTLVSMSGLASSTAALGRHAEAVKLFEEALALQRARLGPDHPGTLLSMNNLANSHAALGRPAEALKLREETLALRRTKLGPDHPDTLMSMNNLAVSYADLGRPAEAVKLHEETLALRRAKLGPDHPDTLWSMSGLAYSYAALGRPAEAVKLFEEALALQRARLGPDHPGTLLSMNNLANSHAALGRPAEALKLREETLALRRAKLGPDHPDTLMSMNNLAVSYADLGRPAEAVKLREQTLALRRAKLGPDHPDTLWSMSGLAYSYAALGRHAEAVKLFEEALALQRAKLGPDHPDTLVSMSRLAASLFALDRPSEAVSVIDDCLRLAEGKVLHPQLVPFVISVRLRAFVKLKDPSGCQETAELWERLDRKDAISLYIAACYRAVAASVLRVDTRTPGAAQKVDADQAMAWLVKAVEAGFNTPENVADMVQNADLDALRDRADFRRLLAVLFERDFPKDPFEW